jgi:hypothetical protein
MNRRRAFAWVWVALGVAAGGCGSSGASPGHDATPMAQLDAALDGVLTTKSAVIDAKDAAPDAADAGSPDGSIDGAVVLTPELCNQKCALLAQIDCPGAQTLDTCISKCVGDSSCIPERVAYYQCLLAGGPDVLECDSSLPAVVLKDGFCTQQSDAYFDCD